MQLIGLARLGRDAELKQTTGGTNILNMTLAYNYGREKETQWIDASMFGERAAKLAQYFTKGTAIVAYMNDVYVHTYQKKDGTTGTTLRATLVDFEFGGGKREASQDEPAPRAETPKLPGNVQDLEDSIPFANPYRGRLCYVV